MTNTNPTPAQTIIKRDGVEIARVDGDPMAWFHRNVSYSMDHALKFEGYSVETAEAPAADSYTVETGYIRDGVAVVTSATEFEGTPRNGELYREHDQTESAEYSALGIAKTFERVAIRSTRTELHYSEDDAPAVPAGWTRELFDEVESGRISYRAAVAKAANPETAEEWAAFLSADSLPLSERLALVAALASDARQADGDAPNPARDALAAIIPGDGAAAPEILDAVAVATGRPRIVAGENGVVNTAPAARASLMRHAARTA